MISQASPAIASAGKELHIIVLLACAVLHVQQDLAGRRREQVLDRSWLGLWLGEGGAFEGPASVTWGLKVMRVGLHLRGDGGSHYVVFLGVGTSRRERARDCHVSHHRCDLGACRAAAGISSERLGKQTRKRAVQRGSGWG